MNTAVYARVSTEGQRTDSQELELKRYCRQRGWRNVTYYADKISGAKASRPQLDQLMQDIRAGKIERLIVYKLDRLGRSLTHLALILDELNRLNVPLIASSQGIDTSNDNPAGDALSALCDVVVAESRPCRRDSTPVNQITAQAKPSVLQPQRLFLIGNE